MTHQTQIKSIDISIDIGDAGSVFIWYLIDIKTCNTAHLKFTSWLKLKYFDLFSDIITTPAVGYFCYRWFERNV